MIKRSHRYCETFGQQCKAHFVVSEYGTGLVDRTEADHHMDTLRWVWRVDSAWANDMSKRLMVRK